MEEKIKRLGILCRKKGLTQEENREFKKLEKSITDVMQKDELIFATFIDIFKKAIEPVIG